MPTPYTDQFFTFDPANPPAVGTPVSFSIVDFIDQDDDDDIGSAGGDSVNGSDVTASWPGDTVTINVPGVGNVSYTGITFYTADGGFYFTPTDGQVLQNGTFAGSSFVNSQAPLDVSDLGPPCFVAGTRIQTSDGSHRVEEIEAGDWVRTMDRGLQQVRWSGQRTVRAEGAFAPICVSKGSLGNSRQLLVSPQHRMLLSGWKAELYFGAPKILVAAKHLVDHDRIFVLTQPTVTYVHLLFDHHEIVFAEDAPTESLDPSGNLASEDPFLREELQYLFPELVLSARGTRTARRIARRYEASVLAV